MLSYDDFVISLLQEEDVLNAEAVEKALAAHRDYLMSETLAIEWEVGQSNALYSEDRELGDEHWKIELRK